MAIGKDKRAKLIIRSRKRQITERIKQPNKERIGTHNEKENQKYLGILEVDNLKEK